MIETIYILDADSGVCLFNADFIEFEVSKTVDGDIFSSFLKVVDDLSQESRQEEVNSIILASSRLVYEKKIVDNRKLLFISIDNQKKKDSKIRNVLQDIAEDFIQDFKEDIINFGGNISTFLPFKEKVMEKITQEFGSFKEKMELKKKQHPLSGFQEKMKQKHEEMKEKRKQRRENFKLKMKKRKEKKRKKKKEKKEKNKKGKKKKK